MPLLESAFEKVKFVKEHKAMMCLDPDRIPVSISDLKWVIGEYTQVSIEMYVVQFGSNYVYGLEERYASSAKIYIRADQGNFMSRYTAAKELSHILVDSEDDWDPKGSSTIDKLLLQLASPPGENDSSVQSENLAGYVAIELLYPYEHRRGDAESVEKGKLTLEYLSMHYEIPVNIVGIAIHPIYMNIMGKVWEELA